MSWAHVTYFNFCVKKQIIRKYDQNAAIFIMVYLNINYLKISRLFNIFGQEASEKLFWKSPFFLSYFIFLLSLPSI